MAFYRTDTQPGVNRVWSVLRQEELRTCTRLVGLEAQTLWHGLLKTFLFPVFSECD